MDYQYYYNEELKPVWLKQTNTRELNNKALIESAEKHAARMKLSPSWLEKQMMEFLDNHNIEYEFQKIFYIKDRKQCIRRYFIADFFIPNRNLIIEMDGKFHKEQKEYDDRRTAIIKEHFRKTKVIRFTYEDLMGMKWDKILSRINDAAYSRYRKIAKKNRKAARQKKADERRKIEARPSIRL